MEYKTEEQKMREAKYAKKVALNREKGINLPTPELVIGGLKFIAEHQSFEQGELVDGLLDIGCNFTLEDIKKSFTKEEVEGRLYDGVKEGSICTGASIIVNARDSEFGRSFCSERLLSVDDNESIYHFIRLTTGDPTYTKDIAKAIEAKNKSKK